MSADTVILRFPSASSIMRIAQRSRVRLRCVIVLLSAGVLVACSMRRCGYLAALHADFSFMFLAAAVLLAFIVNENLDQGSVTRNLLMKVLLVLVSLSVLYSLLVCFIPETGWFSDVYPWAYQDIIETAQLWT